MPGTIGVQDRITAKNVVLKNAGGSPGPAAVDRMRKSSLAKIRRDAVELPPTDTHPVSVGRIDANGGLICGVANNVIAAGINVDLITRVSTEPRDQSGRRGYGRGYWRWVIVFFKRLLRKRLGGRESLTRGDVG